MYQIKQIPYKALKASPFYFELISTRDHVDVYLALDGHEPVGLMVLEGRRLLHLYVIPEARRAGVATQMLSHARYLNSNHELYVPVSVANREMQAFLVKNGFILNGRHRMDGDEGFLFIDRKVADSPLHTKLEQDFTDNAIKLIEKAYVVETLPVYLTE